MITHLRKALLFSVALVFAFSSVASASTTWAPKAPRQINGRNVVYIEDQERQVRVPVVDGRFVVQFTNHEDVKNALASYPFNNYKVETVPLDQGLPGLALYRIDFPANTVKDMANMQADISRNEYVKRSDPDVLAFVAMTPNDTDFGEQYSLYNDGSSGGTAGSDIGAPEAWNVETGDSDVDIFVLDTGISMQNGSLTHPDLDDTTRVKTIANVPSPGNDPADDYGHGTHVAGTIGAETDNATGIAGVMHNCTLKIIKTFTEGTGTLSDESTSLAIAILGALLSGDPTIVNGSWHLAEGTQYVGDASIESLLAYPSDHGMTNLLFVFAAGNHSSCPALCADRPVVYPAAYADDYDEVIAVAATDHDDDTACFSACGPEITLAAPGYEVYSTTPTYDVGGCSPPDLDYDEMSGTSMAAPHVAGVAGLLWSAVPGATATQVRTWLMDGAIEVGTIPYVGGRNDEYGDGRLSACSSLVQAGVANWATCLRLFPFPVSAQQKKTKIHHAAFFFPYLLPFAGLGVLRARIRAKKNKR